MDATPDSETPAPLAFPHGFLWGAATAAHQYEGGNFNNQWYRWEQTGHIHTGEQAGDAVDWWRRAEEDFDRVELFPEYGLRIALRTTRLARARPGT